MLVSRTSSDGVAFCLVALAALLAATGCDDRTARVPVAGQVLIDGQPLTGGYIWIEPANDRAATGTIDAQGRFRMTTYETDDGCVLGTHRVAVASTKQLSPERTQHLVPVKYRESATSELTVTIDQATDNLKIELTWAGGEPFVEEAGGTGDRGPESVGGGAPESQTP